MCHALSGRLPVLHRRCTTKPVDPQGRPVFCCARAAPRATTIEEGKAAAGAAPVLKTGGPDVRRDGDRALCLPISGGIVGLGPPLAAQEMARLRGRFDSSAVRSVLAAFDMEVPLVPMPHRDCQCRHGRTSRPWHQALRPWRCRAISRIVKQRPELPPSRKRVVPMSVGMGIMPSALRFREPVAGVGRPPVGSGMAPASRRRAVRLRRAPSHTPRRGRAERRSRIR